MNYFSIKSIQKNSNTPLQTIDFLFILTFFIEFKYKNRRQKKIPIISGDLDIKKTYIIEYFGVEYIIDFSILENRCSVKIPNKLMKVFNQKVLDRVKIPQMMDVLFPVLVVYDWEQICEKSLINIPFKKQGCGLEQGYSDILSPIFTHSQAWLKTLMHTVKTFDGDYVELNKIQLNLILSGLTELNPELEGLVYNYRDEQWSNLGNTSTKVFLLFIDIMYRCIQLNPRLRFECFSQTSGVIILQNFGEHLYIVPLLKKIFPNISFLIYHENTST